MDIASRKLNIVQEFLKISDEELIEKLEFFLRDERKKRTDKGTKSMTINEFNQMIDKAEADIESGRLTDAGELIKIVEKWK